MISFYLQISTDCLGLRFNSEALNNAVRSFNSTLIQPLVCFEYLTFSFLFLWGQRDTTFLSRLSPLFFDLSNFFSTTPLKVYLWNKDTTQQILALQVTSFPCRHNYEFSDFYQYAIEFFQIFFWFFSVLFVFFSDLFEFYGFFHFFPAFSKFPIISDFIGLNRFFRIFDFFDFSDFFLDFFRLNRFLSDFIGFIRIFFDY